MSISRGNIPDREKDERRSVPGFRSHASIDQDILLGLLAQAVPDRRVLDLLRQYVRRTIYDGGLYEDVERGISLGCPLSPLLGALYLQLLDERV
jgi:RNA-directed DNA polymerase